MLRLRDDRPDRFCAFVKIDPLVPDPLARVQQYVRRGADGLKLYRGHGSRSGSGPFHSMPLDDARLLPLWAWLERSQLPVMLHVNLKLYGGELVRVLDAFPQLRICIPHFGLSKNTNARLARLVALFARYPNLYSDVSFGWHRYEIAGFESLAKWRTRSKELLTRYADRFLFGVGLVLEPSKPEGHALATLRAYRIDAPPRPAHPETERGPRGCQMSVDSLRVRRKISNRERRASIIGARGGHSG